MMTLCYGYVSASSIFHMHLTSYDYNVRHMHISSHIEQTITFSYISKSFPAINGFNKYIAVPEWMSLGSGWPTDDWRVVGRPQPAGCLGCLSVDFTANQAPTLSIAWHQWEIWWLQDWFICCSWSFFLLSNINPSQHGVGWIGLAWPQFWQDSHNKKYPWAAVIWSEYQQTFRVQSRVMVPPLQYM